MTITGRHHGSPPSPVRRRSGRRSRKGFRDALNHATHAPVSGSRGSNYRDVEAVRRSPTSGPTARHSRRHTTLPSGALADRRSTTTRDVSSIARRHDGADRIGVETPEFVENLRAARVTAIRRRRAKDCGCVADVSASDTAVPERPIERQRHRVDIGDPNCRVSDRRHARRVEGPSNARARAYATLYTRARARTYRNLYEPIWNY